MEQQCVEIICDRETGADCRQSVYVGKVESLASQRYVSGERHILMAMNA